MVFKKIYLFLLPALFTVNLFSQKDTSAINNFDKAYTPTGSIFSNGVPGSKKKKAGFGDADLSYGLKFVPFELTKGNLVFENEINIPNTCINITCALGYNIIESYVDRNASTILSNESNYLYLTLQDAVNTGVYEKGGPYLSFGFRSYANNFGDLNPFFSDGDPFNGLYSFFKFSHFSYSYTLASRINNYAVIGDRAFKVSQSAFTYGIGYSAVTTGRIKTIHDLYIGVGLKSISYPGFKEDLTVTYNSSGAYTSTDLQYLYAGKKSNFDVSFTIGYSFGIGF